MTFVRDIQDNSGGGIKSAVELKKVLEAAEISAREDPQGAFWCDYTPGSYDSIRVKLFFPMKSGILGVEGMLLAVEGQPTEELRLAINYLNAEVPTYRFYVSEGDGALDSELMVRYDLFPNLEAAPDIHPRELRQVMTGLCAQKAIFAETLEQIQGGRSWRMVRDALRAIR